MPVALVTRPREDAEGIAAELTARGFDVLVEPLLDIVYAEGAAIDTAGAQGFLATSANGARALARNTPERDLPVWAVGDASAREARRLGFTRVESAGGDVRTLAELVRARVSPGGGALIHAAGTQVAGDLAGLLPGYDVRRAVLYEARKADTLSDSLRRSLETGRIEIALFFSPRTAETFVTLVGSAGLGDRLAATAAYGLSPGVARALAPMAWRAVRTADEPTQAALLAALDHDSPRTS